MLEAEVYDMDDGLRSVSIIYDRTRTCSHQRPHPHILQGGRPAHVELEELQPSTRTTQMIRLRQRRRLKGTQKKRREKER